MIWVEGTTCVKMSTDLECPRHREEAIVLGALLMTEE